MSTCVLIVDPSEPARTALAAAFETAGFTGLTCADGLTAQRVLSTQAIDVLICAAELANATAGADLLRSALTPESGANQRIVLLAGEAGTADHVRGLYTGVDDFIARPYAVHHAISKVCQLISARRSHDRDGNAAHNGLTVLAIDDSPTFMLLLTETLSDAGYRVISAVTGEEGLRVAAAQRPHAIIVDGVLPGIDGATVVRRVRLDAALRSVPCILLTATEEREAELRALESGADAFVRKDQELDLILAKLSALLRISSGGRDAHTTASPLTGQRILAADDSPTYRAQLSQTLHEEGYEVVLASSGEEALELLLVQTVDCIVLDLSMPGISGAEACRRIKATPSLRDVPVIILTALEDRAAMLSGLAFGADDCIPKSAEVEVLKARVQAQLRRRQFAEETRREREQLLRSEMQAAAASSARELAETRAALVRELEHKNAELHKAYAELQATQGQLVQTAKMASLGELVAGVAHEINNPLAFVLSHLDTVKRSLTKVHPDPLALPEASREPWQRANTRLQEMHLGLERIRELVLKLRTFSRLDEGEYKRVSIRECVEALLTILEHRLKDRIEVITEYGEPDQLDCYPGLLTQAIMNLVVNSIDAITGPGKIFLTTGRVDSSYLITVTDTGHGIPQHLHDRVLEPFFTTKPVGEGTGLGLSITYSIVRKHNGRLVLREAPTGGTQAMIELPLDSVETRGFEEQNGAEPGQAACSPGR
jgi:two-component system NtrC family sensor kinase